MSAMTEKCFDEGQIQAFLDGELDNDSLELVARHVSVCDDCALLLAEAESESAFAFSALDNELNSLVPTERIRTNLYEAIAAEKQPFWKKIFGGKFSLLNPSIAAFASLALIVGVFTTLYIVRENRMGNSDVIAQVEKTKSLEAPATTNPQSTIVANPVDGGSQSMEAAPLKVKTISAKSTNQIVLQNAAYRGQKAPVKDPSPKPLDRKGDVVAPPVKDEDLPGEDSYIKTIATLSETVNSRKDEILRPSARVAFEKDLAVVDDSITKMQKEIRTNPKNEAAKQLLRASYQNKIDLLNSVADKNDLMATLK